MGVVSDYTDFPIVRWHISAFSIEIFNNEMNQRFELVEIIFSVPNLHLFYHE